VKDERLQELMDGEAKGIERLQQPAANTDVSSKQEELGRAALHRAATLEKLREIWAKGAGS
jgi:hypothetical protein